MRSTTLPRSCAFSASSCSSNLCLLRLETCLFEAPLGCRACSRATCRLSTFFILFDREISFMNHPPGVPSVGQSEGTRIDERRSETARPVPLWRLRSGPQSLPIDPEMLAPRTSRDGEHLTFQTVPAGTALSFLPVKIPPTVCSVCHTRHTDTPLQ